MSATLARAAPVRFLAGIAALWVIGRGLTLVDWSTPLPIHHDAGPDRPATALLPGPILFHRRKASLHVAAIRTGGIRSAPPWSLARTEAPVSTPAARESAALPLPVAPPAAMLAIARPAEARSRWSGSGWIFARGGGRASALSPVGQIGGGQAGARLLYRLDRTGALSAAVRLSGTIGGMRQTEAAAGIDWKPVAALPVHLMIDRRFAIDRGGRNAWAAGVAGGVDAVAIAPRWRLDAYAEAGVVGARRRDRYADGAARIARSLDLGGGRSIAVGGGVWGAAQPGVARLDIGPSAVLRLPVAHHGVAIALDWRERALGDALPGSGIALTIATDF